MAGTWYNISLVMLCINIFMYIGASQMGATVINLENDAVSQFLTTSLDSDNILNESTNIDIGINKTIVSMPERQSTESTTGTILNILDNLDIVFDGIVFIFNIAFAPLVLFKIQGIPFVIAFILAVPMVILFWMSIIQFIRGAD